MGLAKDEIKIASRDYWYKIVDFLQQNWALIDIRGRGVVVLFLDDVGGVFDEITFEEESLARAALQRNGFSRYAGDSEASRVISPPNPPFHRSAHPNGAIYSSGSFWR